MVDRLALQDGLALACVATNAVVMFVRRLLKHHLLVALSAGHIGTGCLLMLILLMHPDLVELFIVQLVDLHLLNFVSWVDWRGPHGSIDAAITSNVLLRIIGELTRLLVPSRVRRRGRHRVFARNCLATCNRGVLLRVVLLRSHLLVRYHRLHGALGLPGRVENALMAGHDSCVAD